MRRLIFVLFSILFIGCNHSSQIKGRSLNDTLEAIKKLSDFKPLNQADAYDFINRYYLPRLDTLPTKRKIFLFALNGVDFKGYFKEYKDKLQREYAGDTTIKAPPINLFPPTRFNKKFSWDSRRLLKTKIIADTEVLMDNAKILKDFKAWHNVYGGGYMCISYPQFNSNTKRLVLREWLENRDQCGTGRERKFYFTRIPGGWKAD
jgi:hypothetical protein